MVSALRVWVERLLPWYQPELEQRRDARTARIARRSEFARIRAERVIAEYRRAEARARAAGDTLVEEARR